MTLTAGSAPDLRGLLDRIGQQVEAAPELARQDAARPNEVSRLGRDLAAAVQVRSCASGVWQAILFHRDPSNVSVDFIWYWPLILKRVLGNP